MNFEIPLGKRLISLSIPDKNIINFKCRDSKESGLKEEQDLIRKLVEIIDRVSEKLGIAAPQINDLSFRSFDYSSKFNSTRKKKEQNL